MFKYADITKQREKKKNKTYAKLNDTDRRKKIDNVLDAKRKRLSGETSRGNKKTKVDWLLRAQQYVDQEPGLSKLCIFLHIS